MKNLKLILFILAICFLYFSNGRFSFALAAWLFPALLLFVTRNSSKKFVLFVMPLTVAITLQLSFWRFTSSTPTNILFFIPFFAGLIFGLIFYVDRILYFTTNKFRSTLFFPLLYTSVDFLNGLFNPFGTTGVLAYSQIDFLPFAQLAAITGVWGLTFMITWFGSVVNWAIINHQQNNSIKKGMLIYSTILLIIVSFGNIRLLLPINNTTVSIAGLHTTDKELDGKAFWKALAKKDTVAFNACSNNQLNNLITATRQQANGGAKIILWSEVSPTLLNTKEDSVYNVLKTLAKELNVYLVANPYVATISDKKPENKIWFFDTAGTNKLTHYKYGGNFIEGSVEGNKKLISTATPYGNLSSIICWDADFPDVVRQLGKKEVAICFNPASDWREIDPIHSIVAAFRGIENGCSWVRQTRNGLSFMNDPRGKTLVKMDHFETDNWVNKANVPTVKMFTLYPIIGDLFGWLAIIGFLFLLISSLYKRLFKNYFTNSLFS